MEDLCNLVVASLSLHLCPPPVHFEVTPDDREVQEHALIFLNHMDLLLVRLFVQNALILRGTLSLVSCTLRCFLDPSYSPLLSPFSELNPPSFVFHGTVNTPFL